jgi:hypothetical protein
MDPSLDLKTAARLFAWLLSPDGKIRKKIPPREHADWARADVWEVLHDVTTGKIISATAFREAINRHPLSQHFIEQRKPQGGRPEAPRPWRTRAAIGVAALVVIGLAVSGFLLVSAIPSPRPPHPLCPDCPGTTALYPGLTEFERADADPARELAALKMLYDSSRLDSQPDRRSREQKCRAKLLAIAEDHLGAKAEEVVARMYREGNAANLMHKPFYLNNL